MAASQSPPRRSRELGAPLLSEPPEKSSQSLPSPRSPAALRAHPACDRAFLSLAPDLVWSLQTQQIPVVHSPPLLPGEEGESPRICRLLGPCWRSSGPTVPRITVYGNPELRARAWAPSLQPASLLRYLGALPHSGTPGLSVTPRVLRPHCPTRVPPPA